MENNTDNNETLDNTENIEQNTQDNHEEIANAIANNENFVTKIVNGIKTIFQEEDPIMENDKTINDEKNETQSTETQEQVDQNKLTLTKDELTELLAETLKNDRAEQSKIANAQKEIESKLQNVDDKFKEFVEFKLKNETDFDVNAFLEDKPQYKKVVSTTNKNETINDDNKNGNSHLDIAKNIINKKYGK